MTCWNTDIPALALLTMLTSNELWLPSKCQLFLSTMFGANIHRTSAVSLSSLALERQRSDTCLARESRKSLPRTTKSSKKCWLWLKSCTNKDVLKPLGRKLPNVQYVVRVRTSIWAVVQPKPSAYITIYIYIYIDIYLRLCQDLWLQTDSHEW